MCAVGQLSQFLNNPSSKHLLGAKRVLRYLQGTSTYGITYRPPPLRLQWRHGYPKINYRLHCHAQQWSNCMGKSTTTYGGAVDNGIGVHGSHRGHKGIEMDSNASRRAWLFKR